MKSQRCEFRFGIDAIRHARDLMGSYTIVLSGFAIVPLVLAFAMLFFAKPPERRKKDKG